MIWNSKTIANPTFFAFFLHKEKKLFSMCQIFLPFLQSIEENMKDYFGFCLKFDHTISWHPSQLLMSTKAKVWKISDNDRKLWKLQVKEQILFKIFDVLLSKFTPNLFHPKIIEFQPLIWSFRNVTFVLKIIS